MYIYKMLCLKYVLILKYVPNKIENSSLINLNLIIYQCYIPIKRANIILDENENKKNVFDISSKKLLNQEIIFK